MSRRQAASDHRKPVDRQPANHDDHPISPQRDTLQALKWDADQIAPLIEELPDDQRQIVRWELERMRSEHENAPAVPFPGNTGNGIRRLRELLTSTEAQMLSAAELAELERHVLQIAYPKRRQ